MNSSDIASDVADIQYKQALSKASKFIRTRGISCIPVRVFKD